MPKETGLFSRTARVLRRQAINPGAAAAGGSPGNGGGMVKKLLNNYRETQTAGLKISKDALIALDKSESLILMPKTFVSMLSHDVCLLLLKKFLTIVAISGTVSICYHSIKLYQPDILMSLYYNHLHPLRFWEFIRFLSSEPLHSDIYKYCINSTSLEKSIKCIMYEENLSRNISNSLVISSNLLSSVDLLEKHYLTPFFETKKAYIDFNHVINHNETPISYLGLISNFFIDSSHDILLATLSSYSGLVNLKLMLIENSNTSLTLYGSLTPYICEHPLIVLLKNIDNKEIIDVVLSQNNGRLSFLIEKNYVYYSSLIEKLESIVSLDEELKLLLNNLKKIINLGNNKSKSILSKMEDIDEF